MKRIDDQTRKAILDLAEDLESDGGTVNRRAFAREFGVSPQTVARILDGPNSRRGAAAGEVVEPGGSRLAVVLIGAGLAIAVLVGYRRGAS